MYFCTNYILDFCCQRGSPDCCIVSLNSRNLKDSCNQNHTAYSMTQFPHTSTVLCQTATANIAANHSKQLSTNHVYFGWKNHFIKVQKCLRLCHFNGKSFAGRKGTAYCIWSVISSILILHPSRWTSSLSLCHHVPSKIDPEDWNWRLRLNDTPNTIGCSFTNVRTLVIFLVQPVSHAEDAFQTLT